MERSRALDELPTSYATALRLRDAGCDRSLIAAGLAVEPEAVDLLLEVAERKLADVLVDRVET